MVIQFPSTFLGKIANVQAFEGVVMRVLVGLCLLAGCATPAPVSPRDEAVLLLNDGIGRADVNTVRATIGPHYKQHNPGVPDGPNGIIDMVKYLATLPPEQRPHPHIRRVIVDGDFIVIHAEYTRGDVSGAGIDMFRVENGKLAEHWDAGRPSPKTTKNGHTTLDGETEIRDRDKTAANKELVRRFAEEVLVKRDVASFDSFFGAALVQHDPAVADGASAWRAALDASTLRYEAVVRVIGEGNFVAVESRATGDGKLTVVWDLFRVDAGAIAEHWITSEEVPAHMAHANGMF